MSAFRIWYSTAAPKSPQQTTTFLRLEQHHGSEEELEAHRIKMQLGHLSHEIHDGRLYVWYINQRCEHIEIQADTADNAEHQAHQLISADLPALHHIRITAIVCLNHLQTT